MMKIATIGLLLILTAICNTTFAQIYTYSNATNGAPSFVSSNATGTNITAYGDSTNTACAQGYSGRDGFNISGFSTTNPSLGIVVKPNSGYALNITGFTVRTRRSGTGPQNIRMAYSLNGGNTWTDKGSNDAPKNGSCATSTSGTNQATWSVSLSVTNTTNGIIFRIFPHAASSASGTIQIWGAFNINGSVDPVVNCTPPTLSNSVTNVTCNGGNDGAIALTTIGGTSPFSYSWTGPNSFTSTSKNLSGLTAGNYMVVVTATGNCKDTAYPVVTEPAPVTPSIQITANPGDTICSGTNVTFTATSSNTGTSPVYQWKVNNSNVGTNSPTYTTGTLSNNDNISCVLISNAACATPVNVTSNSITMTVNAPVAPSITIAASPGTTVCSSTNVMFTATTSNGGSTPAYQWKLNGSNVGSNTNSYNNSSISNNDVITCNLSSNATCVSTTTATSNTVTMSVVSTVTPTISINTGSNAICAGTTATFTANTNFGGVSPAFQWKINGSNVATNSSTYSTTTLVNSDVVTCEMTSSSTCATPTTATSNSIIMTINPIVAPTISIAASATNICTNSSVTFTATTTNNSNSILQWKVNGSNVGTNSSTYISNSLSNNDDITCVLTSAQACASPGVVTSNTITINVSPVLTPSINIVSGLGNSICAGSAVTFTASPTNGGASPSYQWKVNGINTGTNNSTYTASNISNGDAISCVLTSSYMCSAQSAVTSNVLSMTVDPIITPSVSITSTQNTICSGSAITFTATPVNGGTPVYQWKVNGNNAGSNSSSFTTNSLANNDVVTCVMATSLPCATSTTATSNSIIITVNPVLTPSILISSSHGNQACSTQTVTFTASVSNQGTAPLYQWQKNGINVGGNTITYADGGLLTGDKIKCILTSNAACVNSTNKISNEITMTIDSLNTSQAFIVSSSLDSVCEDEVVTFYCHFTKGGNGYQFQWIRNGIEMPGNTAGTYTTDSLKDKDIIQCRFTNGYNCAQPVTTTPINIVVSPNDTPTISIQTTPGFWGDQGTNVTFSSKATRQGANPRYQWMKNYIDIPGATGATYSTTELNNKDKVALKMYTSLPCADYPYVVSNVVVMKTGTDISEVNVNSIELYPNPNNGNFTIKADYPGNSNNAAISIINSTGQIVHHSIAPIIQNTFKYQVRLESNLASGLYIIKISFADTETQYLRFSITH